MSQSDVISKIETDICAKYSNKGWDDEWGQEKQVLLELVTRILEKTKYQYLETLPAGTTAVVLGLWDESLRAKRAMKIPRPRKDFEPEILEGFEGEIDRLLSINHQNVVKIYGRGVESHFQQRYPFFIMEYVEGGRDLEKAFAGELIQTPANLLDCIRQVAIGLEYLHGRGIVHFDIKPGNILVDLSSHAMITDLGFSKKIDDVQLGTELIVRCTRRYAHPKLLLNEVLIKNGKRDPSGATRVKVTINDLADVEKCKSYDRFALGQTIFELLSNSSNPAIKGLTTYQFRYLRLIGARLLEGYNTQDQLWENLPGPILNSLKYQDTTELKVDTERLTGEYALESDIPELSTYIPDLIQIPGIVKVPFTPRVERIIDSPALRRLAQISQLGLLVHVYPSACHTRFEHVLGTFAAACEYVRALYADEGNPLFRSIMRKSDIETVLVAALLHDVGQYPLAHDIEDVSEFLFRHGELSLDVFGHEEFSRDIVAGNINVPGTAEKLIDVVEGRDEAKIPECDHWRVNRDMLIHLVGHVDTGDFRETILKSIISGPLDADKVDYIYRDSVHLGIAFGTAVDFPRLMKCLSICWDPSTPERPVLGLLDQGRVAGEAIAFARYALFSAAHWHPTARAIKAMIQHVVNLVLEKCDDSGAFRRDFSHFVFGAALSNEQLEFRPGSTKPSTLVYDSQARPEDIQVLEWLAARCGDRSARGLVADLKERRLYKRFLEFGPEEDTANDVKRLRDKGPAAWEECRKAFETVIGDKIDAKEKKDLNEIRERLDGRPLILLDSPWRYNKAAPSLLIRRDRDGHQENLRPSPILEMLYNDDYFSKQVSRTTVFVNPHARSILTPWTQKAKVWFQDVVKERL